MKRFLLLFQLFPGALLAQLMGPLPVQERAIRQNSVSVMDASNDTVWIGPKLNYTYRNSPDWLTAPADSVANGRFSVFSLAVNPGRIVAGLGFYRPIAGASTATSGGFYTSSDGGATFSYIPAPIDPQGTVSRVVNGDSLKGFFNFRYGSRNILALAVTVPEQSVPWDVDAKNGVIFSAMWASGIRRSRDWGQTWERLLLPPFEQSSLNLQSTYNFIFQPTPPRPSDTANPNTSESWTNFLGFSVLIDNRQTVWAGTAGGLNWSPNAYYAATDSVTWQHAVAGSGVHDLPSNWIITIKQNPVDSTIWMTNWIGNNSAGQEKFGISSTRNGSSFNRFLIGEKIYDLAFHQNSIFAAGDNGLFWTTDQGRTWQQQRGFRSTNNRIAETAGVQAITSTGSHLWVATTEGLAVTPDNGRTWSIIRTNFPLSGKNQFVSGGKADSYAYPNPFSSRQHSSVRIRFTAAQESSVLVRIYDQSMQFVRELGPARSIATGEYEMLWDGTNRFGRIVPNGVYFYSVTNGGRETTGKILVLD